MKTTKSIKSEIGVFKDTNSVVKCGKKLSQSIKTEAATDKENFGKQTSSEPSIDMVKTCDNEKIHSMKREESVGKIVINTEDLTANEPSATYWKVLAEHRRKLLYETLEENEFLHEKVELLEKENNTLKLALADATEVIDFLNEIVKEDAEENSD